MLSLGGIHVDIESVSDIGGGENEEYDTVVLVVVVVIVVVVVVVVDVDILRGKIVTEIGVAFDDDSDDVFALVINENGVTVVAEDV